MYNISFNFLAIVVAAFVSVMIGGIYFAVFGKFAAKFNNVAQGDGKKMQQNMTRGYIGIFLANLFMAFGLAYFVAVLKVSSLIDGIWLTVWLFIGFVGPLTIGPVLWEGKSIKSWIFNNVINVICLFVMIIILAFW